MTGGTEVAAVLREHGYRFTRPREVVWRVLTRADEHLTAEQITERAQDISPGTNLASVYRCLSLLEELGLVRESRLGEGEAARWELSHPDEHFHLVCDECGGVSHHAGDLVERIRSHLDTEHGFEASTIELVVAGRCGGCSGHRDGPD